MKTPASAPDPRAASYRQRGRRAGTAALTLLGLLSLACSGESPAPGEGLAAIPEPDRPAETSTGETEGGAADGPWTAPVDPTAPGFAGAAQLLAAGDHEAALARIRETEESSAEGPSTSHDAHRSPLEIAATRARAARLAGEPGEAVAALESVVSTRDWNRSLPPDVITLELARARLDLAATLNGEQAAAQRLQAAKELARGTSLHPNRFAAPMRVMRAEALAAVEVEGTEKEQKRAANKAAEALADVIERYPKHVDVGRFMVEHGRALERAGRVDEASEAYRRVVIERGEEAAADQAREALERLVAAGKIRGAELTRRERLRQASAARDLHMHEFSNSVAEALMAEDLDAGLRRDARLSRAWARYKIRNYDACVDDMTVLYADSPTANNQEHLLRCLRYAGRYAEGVDVLERAAKKSKNKAVRQGKHMEAINFAVRGGLYERAQTLLDAYENKYKGEAERRRWFRAWLPYRLGDPKKALKGFEQVIRNADAERQEAAVYFRARVLFESADDGERSEGIAELERLVERAWTATTSNRAAPGFRVYYGLMARERLLQAGLPAPEPPELEPMPLAERTFGYAETRGVFAQVLAELDGASPTLERANALHRIGYLDEAQREYRVAAYELVHGKKARQRQSIKMPRTEAVEVGLSWKAEMDYPKPMPTKAARALLKDDERAARWTAGMRELAAAIGEPYFVARFTPSDDFAYAQRYFLRAYREPVERTAAQRGIEPFHIWALMYTESRFRRYVLSYVGARGALQIYPPAWRRRLVLAGEFDGRLDVDGLFQIDTALAHSLRTGPKLLDEFDGHHALLYGSYNGGGHNIRRWLWAKQQDGKLELDVFVEEIGFRETRRYVRRVLAVHSAYELIYRDQVPRIRTDLDGIFAKAPTADAG